MLKSDISQLTLKSDILTPDFKSWQLTPVIVSLWHWNAEIWHLNTFLTSEHLTIYGRWTLNSGKWSLKSEIWTLVYGRILLLAEPLNMDATSKSEYLKMIVKCRYLNAGLVIEFVESKTWNLNLLKLHRIKLVNNFSSRTQWIGMYGWKSYLSLSGFNNFPLHLKSSIGSFSGWWATRWFMESICWRLWTSVISRLCHGTAAILNTPKYQRLAVLG